jgi:hypothetical protein
MNLPEYRKALQQATAEYDMACQAARDKLQKAIAAANEQFFEDTETAEMEKRVHVREDRP